MQMSCWEWSKPSWPCEAWPSDPIFFPDTYNDLVTFPVVVPVSSPFSRRLQYPRSGFGGDHDPWPLTRRYFAVTHVWIPRGDLKLRHSNLHELRIYTWYTATSITSITYFYIFGTLPVERDIRNFAPCKIRSNFGKYFPPLLHVRFADRYILI